MPLMLTVTEQIQIPESELEETFVRAGGPGGQNVNKVSAAVRLRFDAGSSPSLPEQVRERLLRLAGRRMTDAGVIVIDAQRFRTQKRNRQDARERLADLIRRAAEPPKARRPTRPAAAANERRLAGKRRLAERKRLRQEKPSDET